MAKDLSRTFFVSNFYLDNKVMFPKFVFLNNELSRP